jgi:hypothetical protein
LLACGAERSTLLARAVLGDLPEVVAEVNARIREIAERSAAATDDWDFMCECGDPACQARVTLSVAEYEALQERKAPVLAPGHRT